MCYCLFGFFWFVFFYETSFAETPFDAGLGRPTRAQRGGRGASPDRRGQFAKHNNNFLNLRKRHRRAAGRKRCGLFREEVKVSSHGVRPFSVHLSLLAPGRQSRRVFFFRLARPPPVWRPAICLSARRCAAGKAGTSPPRPLCGPARPEVRRT